MRVRDSRRQVSSSQGGRYSLLGLIILLVVALVCLRWNSCSGSPANGTHATEAPIPSDSGSESGPERLPGTSASESLIDRSLFRTKAEVAVENARIVLEGSNDRARAIFGIVTDADCRPINGAEVKCYSAHFRDSQQLLVDENGIFVIMKSNTSEARVSIEITHPDYLTRIVNEVTWGGDPLMISLRAPISCVLLVVERGSNANIVDLTVICYSVTASSPFDRRRRELTALDNGTFLLSGLDPCDNILVVLPQDKALLPNFPLTFNASKYGNVPLRVEIERLSPISITVFNATGRPLQGARVQLYDRHDPRLGLTSWDPWRPDMWLQGGYPTDLPWLLSDTETDQRGVALCHLRLTTDWFGVAVSDGGKPMFSNVFRNYRADGGPLQIIVE